MTLEEFNQRCEAAADVVHLMVEQFDDDGDPHGIRQAILARHLLYVLPPDVIAAISGRVS